VSDARTLQPGPWHKTPAWRGGAFLLGFAFLLIILDWVVGSFIDIGVGRFLLVLVVGGVVLTAPQGLGLGRKPAVSRPTPPADLVPQARVQGESGSTYVIVAPAEAPAEAPAAPTGPRAKVREFTPGWYALYTVFWRFPVYMGDYALTALWRLVAHIRGTRNERPNRSLDFDRPETLPQPDRETF
jgi:hypothetical protein